MAGAGLDWAWVTTIGDSIASRARDFLKQVVDGFDQMADRIIVSAIPEEAGPYPGIGTEDYWVEEQAKTGEMLRKRGVLTRVEYSRQGGPGGGQEGFLVEAEERVVREAYRRLEERLRPPVGVGRPASPLVSGAVGVVIHARDHASIVVGDQVNMAEVNTILDRIREVEDDPALADGERKRLAEHRGLIESEMRSAGPKSGRINEFLRGAGRVLEKVTTAAGSAAAQAAIKQFLGQ